MFLEIQTFKTNESRLSGDRAEIRFPGTLLVFEVAGHPQENGQSPKLAPLPSTVLEVITLLLED